MRKTKIQIVMSEKLNNDLQELAQKYGMTKSAVCTFILGNYMYRENEKESVAEQKNTV